MGDAPGDGEFTPFEGDPEEEIIVSRLITYSGKRKWVNSTLEASIHGKYRLSNKALIISTILEEHT